MVKLYVEGGGDHQKDLKIACRKGFRLFLERAGVKGDMPRIIACGGRQNAYDSFCAAVAKGEHALLLVDSEAPVSEEHQKGQFNEWLPWEHLAERKGDGWEKPEGVDSSACHLMVQCMESWFIADSAVLQKFFGQGFNKNALPSHQANIEGIPKKQVFDLLKKATRFSRTKGEYGKGRHSFQILQEIDPQKVVMSCPWANRFITELAG